MSHTTHPGLDALWLTEAVRLREEQAGPLEDSEALRQALAQGGSLPRRILTRAHWLGRREGLLDAQRTWRQGSRLALALPIQYADYALWQRSWMEAGEKERQLAYWTGLLG
ncbi:DUF2868 domain-containing protein, partial [Pseudomonas aeruginosa]